ncbi:thiopurine S-methyltransferase [Methylomonas paludis]|uniref:thiopurine S-methyltransferase n=1 Tax=Methylomonas paludis TaxID=1173101 RepID=UPI001FE7C0FF|nr:thiopurine S-methyltransferase [Methylomonas paludis]
MWLQFWRDRRNDFHQNKVNTLLTRFWPAFDSAPGSRVFVPLCGKSLDMLWLANQGYEVIGVELSPIAVKAFFRENRLKPERRRIGKFIVWKYERITILCGDYFALTKIDLGQVDLIYDRAALTALPEDIRSLYVAQLRLIVPEQVKVFLLTAEDHEEVISFADVSSIAAEIAVLYANDFEIELAYSESILESDPTEPDRVAELTDYKLYRLTGRTVAA